MPKDLLQQAFHVSKKLFDLPYETKMKAPHPEGLSPHRGYSSFGKEKTAEKTAKEAADEAQREYYAQITDFKASLEVSL